MRAALLLLLQCGRWLCGALLVLVVLEVEEDVTNLLEEIVRCGR